MGSRRLRDHPALAVSLPSAHLSRGAMHRAYLVNYVTKERPQNRRRFSQFCQEVPVLEVIKHGHGNGQR